MSLDTQLKASYPSYTKTEKKIVDFLLNDPGDFPYLHITLEDLSKQIGVGQASIIRFVRKSGYSTYRSFLADLHASIQKKVIAARIADREAGNSLLADLITKLQTTNNDIQLSTIQSVVDQISHADLIICLGMGNSGHVAALTADRLRAEGLLAHHDVYREIGYYTRSVRHDLHVVVMAFSSSGETPELITQVRDYEEIGAYVVSFTGYLESTLAKYSDAVIYTASQVSSASNTRELHSIITQLYAAEIILEAYLQKENTKREE